MTCPRCGGTLFPDQAPETWEGKELVCLQCGHRVYDTEPALKLAGVKRWETSSNKRKGGSHD